VLIYFDAAGKTRVLEQIAKAILPDGALFLGSAETVIGLTDAFIAPTGRGGFYRPTDKTSSPHLHLKTA
jgi:chemotaxis protein methyltransferase CheR